MNLKRSIASGFALLAAGSAQADEDFIRSNTRGPLAAPAPSGYHRVVEPTLVPACSRDGWLIETSFEIFAHDDLLRSAGGAEPFRRRHRDNLSLSLKELIRDAVESRPASRAVLLPPHEEPRTGSGSIASDLSDGVEKLLAPLEKRSRTRLIVSLSTVHIRPGSCSPP